MPAKTNGVYIPEWHVGKHAQNVIEQLCVGRTLNFPCGDLSLGDTRADIYAPVHPDILADLTNHPFRRNFFDTVFCDPPFAFYTDNRIGWKWIYDIAHVARSRIIYKTPKIRVKLSRHVWKKHYIIIEDNNGMSFQFLQVFDRFHKPLDNNSR